METEKTKKLDITNQTGYLKNEISGGEMMAMDWERSGDDAGASWWRERMFALDDRRGMTAAMAVRTEQAVPRDEQRGAFERWLAHVDAGRIGVPSRPTRP